MNNKMIPFIIIILLIYGLANVYLYIRGLQAISSIPCLKPIYITAFLILSLSFIIGMTLESKLPVTVTTIVQYIGFFWLGAMLYLILFVVALDFIRLLNYLFKFFPEWITAHYVFVKMLCLGIGILAVGVLLTVSYIRFRNPVVKEMTIAIQKESQGLSTLRVVMVSDIHMGYMIQKKQVAKYVDKINALQPDIILIAGDMIDRSIKPLKERKIGDELKKLTAPLGIYAVLGNHEYIGGESEADEYIEQQTGVKLLKDTVINVDGKFYIVGRDDRTNPKRKPLHFLTDSLNKSLPILMLDHQPYSLDVSEKCGIDLQFSGHTHNGQLWPINNLMRKLYENPYGYIQKGNTQIYVTSGLGIWGPPFRIGTVSEITVFDLHFAN